MNVGIYTRKVADCNPIYAGPGETIYELLGTEADAKLHSVAYVTLGQNGSSSAHFHPDAEESYVVLEGEGFLVIDGRERSVKAGDVAFIPKNAIHQIFNKSMADLSFLCVCAPAWTPEGFKLVSDYPQHPGSGRDEPYIRDVSTCFKIDTGKGEFIWELLGKNNGAAEEHSVALVEIAPEGRSHPHLHPVAEESYYVLEGEGQLTLDGQTRTIAAGDLVFIPPEKVHVIENVAASALKFYVMCAPAWTPECSKYC